MDIYRVISVALRYNQCAALYSAIGLQLQVGSYANVSLCGFNCQVSCSLLCGP